MSVTKFSLSSDASIMVGGLAITSFADGTEEADIAGALYEGIRTELISLHPWRFATAQHLLTRRAAIPSARWDAAYELPTDVERVNAVLVNDLPIRFDRFENTIVCDAESTESVYADLTRVIGESYWPGYFQTLMRLKLAARFAIPIAEDAEKANVYEGQFLRHFGMAKTADSQGRTARKMPVGNFAAWHRGRP